MRTGSRIARSTGAGTAALLVALVAWQPAAHARNVFFSGLAVGTVGTVKVGSTTKNILISENQMSCNGVPHEETLLNINNPEPLGLKSSTQTTFTSGRDDTAHSKAGAQTTRVRLPGLAIDADAINAEAKVHCDWVPTHSNPTGLRPVYTVTGGANIGRVTINGDGYEITGEPNQTLSIPDVATIIFNEQTKGYRSLIVSGMHIKLLNDQQAASGDVVVAYARAKLVCEP